MKTPSLGAVHEPQYNSPIRCDRRTCAILISCLKTLSTVDATGLTCPMPLLKAKKALNGMNAGQRLRVLATDPGSVRDFEVFSAQSGHKLLESSQEGGTYRYLLERK